MLNLSLHSFLSVAIYKLVLIGVFSDLKHTCISQINFSYNTLNDFMDNWNYILWNGDIYYTKLSFI